MKDKVETFVSEPMQLKTITYNSNNSGGSWWLTDDNWRDLERAGWEVDWYANKDSDEYKDGRFLGALATSAKKDFPSEEDAISEWERIVGASAGDEGCPCCGAPHYFSEW